MRILVTGNNGYIGTVLTEILYNQSFDVVGLDNNYFEQCSLTKVNNLSNQIIKDIRDVSIKDVKNIDGIIHLASLSNDPLGELVPKVTEDDFRGRKCNRLKQLQYLISKNFISNELKKTGI